MAIKMRNLILYRWEDTGRSVLSGLIIKSNKDPKDYVCAYDDLLEFLNGPGLLAI